MMRDSLRILGSANRARVHRSGLHCTVLFLFLLATALCTFGQEATILGTVTDPSGSVVPNVAITVTHVETGETRSTVTNDSGQYVAPDLPIGHYNVSAKAKGFGPAARNGIVLNVNDRARIDFVLKVGAIQEQVTVEANAVAVQSDSSDVSTVITGQQVAELGTNGRSVYSLYALTAGASSIQGDLVIPTTVGGDNSVSVNGQREGHNLQLLDGTENLDRGGSQAAVMPSIDAIAEFRSLDSNYSAEYGLAGAATITQVIKSGTKRFHASAWWFGRNDDLDARNYFNPAPEPVAELRFNVYGFNVGGQVPLWKEHPTFFFYNMEWRSIVQGGSINQEVPSTSLYGGDFSALALPLTAFHVPCTNQLSAPQTAKFAAAGITTLSTAAPDGNCANDSSGNAILQPFPGSAIPSAAGTSLLDANAQTLLTAGIFPANNATLANGAPAFHGGANSPTTVREELARVDHQFTSKFSVFGHWVQEAVSQTYATPTWSGDNVPTVGSIFGNPSYSAVIHTTYAVSPTLLNEAAFNYDGNRINIIPTGLVSAPSAFTFNRLFTGPNVDTRIPSIDLGGTTGTNYTSNWTPWTNKADDYQLRDDLSWTKGAHQLKFGFSWALYKKVQTYFANTQGNFTFNGSYTGNDFADFLLGYANQYEEDAVQSAGHWNAISMAAYVQDNWRVNHRLTLNLGLRWDGIPHTYEANQQSANFYPNLYNPANAATFDTAGHICSGASDPGCTAASPGLGTSPNSILTGLQFYENGVGIGGVGSIPKGLANNWWPAFGPRIGFAYDLTGQAKTVVRGGFGILYDRVQGNDMYNGATNTPFDASPTLHNVLLANPGTSILTNNTITSAALPILPVGITGIALNYIPPTSYQYSVGVQQALGTRAILAVSYVGSQMRHQNDYREVNLPPIGDVPGLVANSAALNQDMNYLGYGGIKLSENEQNGHYNSLQFDLHGNMTKDLQLQFGYTVSKAYDPSTNGTGSGGDLNNVSNPYAGWKYDQGPSAFDRRNVAFVNYVYQIPLFKNSDNHLLRATVGGWELAGIVTMESGAPLNIGLSGSNASSVVPNSSNRPDLTGSITYPKKPGEWFDPSVFSDPACLTGPDCYGNLGHNLVRGPGRDDWNLSLNKKFVLSEERGSRLEFRAESYNTWNHTQFKGDYNNGGIGTNLNGSGFGVVTAAFDPRVFQLGLKLIF
jgi:hypothetical protein